MRKMRKMRMKEKVERTSRAGQKVERNLGQRKIDCESRVARWWKRQRSYSGRCLALQVPKGGAR